MTKFRVSEVLFFFVNVIFIAVAFLFIEWIQTYASGNIDAEFDFELLKSAWSWAVIISQSALSTYIVNFTISQGYSMRKKRASSNLCQILKTNELRIDKIYSEKRFNDLDIAVNKLNEKSKQQCLVRHMKKINAHIEYDDIKELLQTKNIVEFRKKFDANGVKARKFNKAVRKLLAGKYRDYETVSAEELLSKGVLERGKTETSIKDRRRKVRNIMLLQKATTSILFGAALLVVARELLIDFTIVNTVSILIYFLFAVAGGVYSMMNYCNYIESVFEKRNGIIEEELGINGRWIPPEPPKKKREDDEDED